MNDYPLFEFFAWLWVDHFDTQRFCFGLKVLWQAAATAVSQGCIKSLCFSLFSCFLFKKTKNDKT